MAGEHAAAADSRERRCPILQDALLANHFRGGTEVPVHTWPKGLPDNLRLHITMNHADGPVLPYCP